MPKPKDKYKYLHLILGKARMIALGEDLSKVRSKKILRVAGAFFWNAVRLSRLSSAFAEIAYQARRDASCWYYAEYKTRGKISPPIPAENSGPMPRETMEEFGRQLKPFGSLTSDQRSQLMVHWGVDLINIMLRSTTEMEKAMDALLSSVVIESWSMFENLASDLWVTAVDNGPAILRKRVFLKATKTEKSDDPMDLLTPEDVGPDPQKKLGSAYREARRVSFQRLYNIIRNYEIAFTPTIKTLFRSDEGRYITVLSAYRNALIHNGGKADSTFIKQVKDFPEFRGIKPKQKLALDGEFVAKLRNVSTSLGSQLIQYVDGVLSPP